MSPDAIAHLHGLVVHGLAVHGLSLHGPGGNGLAGFRIGGFHIGGFRFAGFRLKLGRLNDVAELAAIVVLPLAVWIAKRRIDRWEESRRREDARVCAIDVAVTLAKSIQLCDTVRLAIQAGERMPDDIVEAAIESLDLSRQRLRLYLSRHIPLHELIPLAVAAERQLGEGWQAMLTLHGPRDGGSERDTAYAGRLQGVRAELQSVTDRLRGLQPDLGRAIAKVDAGWALPD